MIDKQMLADVERRYHYDAEFHAKVERAMLAVIDNRGNRPLPTHDMKGFARCVVSVALVLEEEDRNAAAV